MKRTSVRYHLRRTHKGMRPVRQHTRKNRGMGVYVYRKSLGGKHTGDITNPEVAQRYGHAPYPDDMVDTEEKQIKLAADIIKQDKERKDIDKVMITDSDDFAIADYKSKDDKFTSDDYNARETLLNLGLKIDHSKEYKEKESKWDKINSEIERKIDKGEKLSEYEKNFLDMDDDRKWAISENKILGEKDKTRYGIPQMIDALDRKFKDKQEDESKNMGALTSTEINNAIEHRRWINDKLGKFTIYRGKEGPHSLFAYNKPASEEIKEIHGLEEKKEGVFKIKGDKTGKKGQAIIAKDGKIMTIYKTPKIQKKNDRFLDVFKEETE